MSSQCRGHLFALTFCPLMGFSPLIFADQLSLPASDLEAPVVSHETMSEEHELGTDLVVKATVTDNQGVKSVTLYYRQKGTEKYKTMLMQRQGGSNEYVAVLTHEITEPGFEYYIQATDNSGNSLLHGYSFSPLKIDVKKKTDQADPAEVADDDVSEDVTPAPTARPARRADRTPSGTYALAELAFLNSELSGERSGTWNTSAVVVRLGKYFTPYFAVEGVVGTGVQEFEKTAPCYTESYSTDSILGVNAKGILDINPQFHIVGSIGIFQGKSSINREMVSGCGEVPFAEHGTSSDAGIGVGAGAEYRINNTSTVHAAYNLYYQSKLLESDLTVSGFALAYKHSF